MVSHGSLDHRANVNSSCHDVANEEGRKNVITLPDVLTHHAKSNEMNYEPSNLTPNFEHLDRAAVSDAFHHEHTSIGASSSERNDDNVADFIADEIPKYRSYVARCSPNIKFVADFEEPLGYESQFQKLGHRNHSESPCRSASSLEKGKVTRDDSHFTPLSIKHNTGKRLASVALDATPRQIRQPRGNVWDRLGKPCEGEGATLHRSLIGESAMLENSCAKGFTDDSNHHIGTFKGVDHPKPKSQFSEIVNMDNTYSCSGSKGDYLHSRKPLLKRQKSLSLSTNNSRLQSLNETIRKVPVTTANNLALGSSSAPSASTINKDDGNAKNEFSDVKSRLRQIEMEMLELRSKKLCASNDKNFSTPSGVPNQSEEDIEARTVLVINVHFAASREDILSHFSKCGVVLKVIILTDSMTARPTGAAYVVFAGKESVDKAVLMTGTSFYSRILTVMPKADMPSEFSSQTPASGPLGKPVHPGHPRTPRKFSFQRKYVTTHLQWIRGQPANENCLSPQLSG
ncbi:Splicing factor RNPS1 SR protein [Dioscorea alata]|nr:Splicing factor RNPS1 SR protein [Dioscorea alata]